MSTSGMYWMFFFVDFQCVVSVFYMHELLSFLNKCFDSWLSFM